MRVTNLGSCCVDHVYRVPHFALPGETLPSLSYEVFPGGKGLNQSLALAFAGADIRHAGRVGKDGVWLKSLLTESGVDTSRLLTVDEPSGHAVIQVTPEGENSIVLFGGANRSVDASDLSGLFDDCTPGEFLLLQNEISYLPEIMQRAAAAGLRIAFNAAPMSAAVSDYPLEHVEIFIVNQGEGAAITGETTTEGILAVMLDRFPDATTVLTLGAEGARYVNRTLELAQPGITVSAIDTTGAGDAFTGYLLAGIAAGGDVRDVLKTACQAAATCVTKPGAASSIPRPADLIAAS